MAAIVAGGFVLTWGGNLILSAVLGPLQHDDFSQNFSHTVFVKVTANHIRRVTMFGDLEAGGGNFGAFATASIDPVFSFFTGRGPGVFVSIQRRNWEFLNPGDPGTKFCCSPEHRRNHHRPLAQGA